MEPQETMKEPAAVPGIVTVPAAPAIGRRRQAMRLLHDQYQEMVLVYELVGPSESDPRTLVFEWGRSSVQLDVYPSNWRDLKDAALLGLRPHH